MKIYRKCSVCKKEIYQGHKFQECELSSCKKHGFCSVNCWNMHNEVLNHRQAGAIEMVAPHYTHSSLQDSVQDSTQDNVGSTNAKVTMPRKILVTAKSVVPTETNMESRGEDEILIVASKLKDYIKSKFDLNTSQQVLNVLSDEVRRSVDRAAVRAKSEGRKTLMDRDF